MSTDARHTGGNSRRPGNTKGGRFSGGFGARDYRQQGGMGPPRSNGPSSRPGGYGGNLIQFYFVKNSLIYGLSKLLIITFRKIH